MGTASAAANVYLEVQTAARQQRRLDLPYRAASESRAALTELSARYNEQNRAADPVAGRAYRRARRNIEAGGQTFSQDYARDHE